MYKLLYGVGWVIQKLVLIPMCVVGSVEVGLLLVHGIGSGFMIIGAAESNK